MSKSKHTPGPWESKAFTNVSRNEDRVHIRGANKRIVAAITNHPGECASLDENVSDEDKANARLIACAPELLQALRNIIDSAPIRGLPRALENDIQLACGLVTKAEGRE